MSTIDPRLGSTLPSAYEARDRQARLDGAPDPVLAELAGVDEALRQAPEAAQDAALLLADAGEPGVFDIAAQVGALSQLDLPVAVERGVDDIAASLSA